MRLLRRDALPSAPCARELHRLLDAGGERVNPYHDPLPPSARRDDLDLAFLYESAVNADVAFEFERARIRMRIRDGEVIR